MDLNLWLCYLKIKTNDIKLGKRHNPFSTRIIWDRNKHIHISISLDLNLFDEKKTWLRVKCFIYSMIYCGFHCRSKERTRMEEKVSQKVRELFDRIGALHTTSIQTEIDRLSGNQRIDKDKN